MGRKKKPETLKREAEERVKKAEVQVDQKKISETPNIPNIKEVIQNPIPKLPPAPKPQNIPQNMPSPQNMPKLAMTPAQAQKLKISPQRVLEFKNLKLREQVIQEKESQFQLLKEKIEAQEENLQLRKQILNQELQNFFKANGFAPGDKILPDPDGGFYIHRPLLEKFSVGLSPEQKK